MRPSVALPAACAAFLLPFAIGCTLSGGVDQVPESIRQRVERAEREGPTADRPTAIQAEALLSSEAVEARFGSLERAQRDLVERNAALERARASADEEARRARAELEAALLEQSRTVGELRAGTLAADEQRARAELARAELQRRVEEFERAAVDRTELVEEERAADAARLAAIEARLVEIDARSAELAPLPELVVRLERDREADAARLADVEAAAAGAGADGGARFARLEGSVLELARSVESLRAEEPLGVAALRTDVGALRDELRTRAAISTDGTPTTTNDSLATTATGSTPAWLWIMDIAILVVVIVAVCIAFVWQRRRSEASDTRLARVERALDGLGQRLEVVAERTREQRAALAAAADRAAAPAPTNAPSIAEPLAPAPAAVVAAPERRSEPNPAAAQRALRPTASIIAAAMASSTSASGTPPPTRWERFVERVEQPGRVVDGAERSAVAKRRVLDQVFLDQYRGAERRADGEA